MKCFWPKCSDHKRCEAFGSCVAKAQAGGKSWPEPGPKAPSPDYQRGWDDCLEHIYKVLGERFTRRAIGHVSEEK